MMYGINVDFVCACVCVCAFVLETWNMNSQPDCKQK